MKRILILLVFLTCLSISALGQSTPPLTVTEPDGSPRVTGVTTLRFSNGSVSCSGKVCTVTTGGGGGGITVGTTTITSGTNTRVLFNNSGVVGEYAITGTGNVMMSASPTTTGRLTGADANFATAVTTGTGATAGFEITANSLTTGNGHEISSSSVSSGNVVSIAATGTAAASNTKTALRISTSGANATSTQTTYGGRFSNTSTGTSSTNIGLDVSASGGSSNFGLNVSGGQAVFQLGSASAPSITFTGDTDSGFFGYGNNQVAWSTNSSTPIGIFNITGARLGLGGQFGWANNADPSASFHVTGFTSNSTGTIRCTNGGTGSCNGFILGTSTVGSIGTSGVSVLAIANGTAPTSSPADEFQMYSADSAAGDANAFARNEAGEINRLTGLSARVSTQFDKTSDTTLANVTGLSRNVEAGRTYAFTAVLYTTSNVAGGVKAAIGGTATATSIIYQADVLDGSTQATVGTARATALATTVGDVTAVTAARITITGTIVVNAAGTLTVQFAQNASNGSASSVLVNSSFQLVPIS